MPLFPPRLPIKLNPRGDFEPERFRILIEQHGSDVTWEQAAQCPCGVPIDSVADDMGYSTPLAAEAVTGAPQAGCLRCGGAGFFLHSAQTVRVVIQDMRNLQRRFQNAGEYVEGTSKVSLYPEHKPSIGDKLTVADSVHVVREMRIRGAAAIEMLRFPIKTQLLDLAAGSTATRVLYVQKANAASDTGLTDNLVEGVDFVVTGDGKINWALGIVSGRAPLVGNAYSISYYAAPRYVITDVPYGIRDTNVQSHAPAPVRMRMPIACTAKLEYLGDRVVR